LDDLKFWKVALTGLAKSRLYECQMILGAPKHQLARFQTVARRLLQAAKAIPQPLNLPLDD